LPSGPPPFHQEMNQQRLRAPQNGAPPQRINQQQQQQQQQQPTSRPMSQRLGPTNGHGPSNSSAPPKSSASCIKILEDYFNQMGLGAPEFKTSKLEKKLSSTGGKSSKKVSTATKYYSTVRVNNQSFQVRIFVKFLLLNCIGFNSFQQYCSCH
jgi:hypothetical protein